jgi:hypothetical protein
MKHLIFVIHGMGIHGDAWEAPYVNAIRAAYAKYPEIAAMPIGDRFEFVAISYGAIFRNLVSDWPNNAALMAALSPGLAPKQVANVADWLDSAGELKRGSFGLTHAADVLLYRGFKPVRERVCTRVAEIMIEKIDAQYSRFGRSSWSAIAHGLGTAVLHDTIARITGRQAKWAGATAFDAKIEQAKLLMMVANVSRVLQTKTADEPYDAYLSSVAPGFPGQSDRACLYYLTARHKFDPFTIPKAFNPVAWPDTDATSVHPPRYVYRVVDHIHGVNVHAFGHYLAHPAVHIPMFRMLLAPEFITAEEERRALYNFDQFGPLGNADAIRIRGRLEDKLPARSDDWTVLGSVWGAFFGATAQGEAALPA